MVKEEGRGGEGRGGEGRGGEGRGGEGRGGKRRVTKEGRKKISYTIMSTHCMTYIYTVHVYLRPTSTYSTPYMVHVL